jgi:hypothetical protein
MFLKLTEADSAMDVYVNPLHIIRFVPNCGDEEGTLIFLTPGAGMGGPHEPQILMVQEHAEEMFRMISRSEKPARTAAGGGGGGANRGFI